MKFTKKQLLDLVKEEVFNKEKLKQLEERKVQVETELNSLIADGFDFINEKELKEEKPSAGLSKEKKSAVVKKAKAGGDIGKKGKGFEAVAKKAAKEYGSAEKGKAVAAAAMWKNIKREGKNTDSNKKAGGYVCPDCGALVLKAGHICEK